MIAGIGKGQIWTLLQLHQRPQKIPGGNLDLVWSLRLWQGLGTHWPVIGCALPWGKECEFEWGSILWLRAIPDGSHQHPPGQWVPHITASTWHILANTNIRETRFSFAFGYKQTTRLNSSYSLRSILASLCYPCFLVKAIEWHIRAKGNDRISKIWLASFFTLQSKPSNSARSI